MLISGRGAVPPALRVLIERGSTVLEERPIAEVPGSLSMDLDRLVFWAPDRSAELAELANACARKEASERREVIVFVAGTPDAFAGVTIPPAELYVWPRDQERLELAFLTGA